jgi:hypothetical protein
MLVMRRWPLHVLDDDGADVPDHELVEAILHAPLPVPARVRTVNSLNIEYDSRF